MTPQELGRAIFHLNQRRGFKSNRKADSGDDDKGKIKQAARKLESAMAESGARTLGEYLWKLHRDKKPVRARLHGEGAKAEYDLYPQRDMIAEEFEALWQAQARHHSEILTKQAREEIADILLFQRPLKPVIPGRCTFNPDDERAPRALPQVQAFRIYQELANLKIRETGLEARPLSQKERDKAADRLLGTKEVKFDALRKALKLPEGALFNLETKGARA